MHIVWLWEAFSFFSSKSTSFVSCRVCRSSGHRNSRRLPGIKGGKEKNTQVCRDKTTIQAMDKAL